MNTLLLTKLKRMSPAWMENHTSEFASSASPQFGKWISGIASILMVFLFSFGTAWSQVDLSLSKRISNGNPNVGQTVTYTLTVKNTGTLPASGVVVKDSLPVGGVSFTGSTVVRGGGAFNPSTKRWNVGNVAAGDSAILNIQATVLAQGVFYNIAEVVQMNEQDADSWPNDGALDQDDLASTCFSVPIDWYQGDEFLVSVPSGYKGIVWFYNGTPISDSTVVAGKTVAVVNQDSSLTIKGIGSFSFTTTVGVSCPASGCCAIQIVQGPIYDLALSKTLAPGQSASVIPGSLVTFRISVTNEGNMPATQIAITDSLPTALTIQDPNWSQTGNIATLTTPLAGPLAPGATIFTDIIVRVNNSFTTGTLTNFAQIQNARDGQGGVFTDRDSSPGNGFNNGEDDRDSEPIQVSPAPVFDLALSKTLAPGQLGNVVPGATVKYRITVTNQGNVPATQIAISDSLPTGLVLQDAAWTLVGNIATLTTPLAGPLAPSATTFVDITTQVSNTYTGSTLSNYAQIKDAKDGQGNPVTDVDSSPGNGFNNGEDDRDSEPIIVGCPVITLVVSNDTTFCDGGSVTLLATAGIAGTTINWYTSPTGNTPFATTASGVPLIQTPTTPTTYYAEATLINGCKSARQDIAVTVGAKPSTPVCQGLIQNICPATTVNLTTVPISPISTPGGVFEWRTGRFPTDPLVTNLTSVGSGTYYLFEKSVSGCYSNPMVIIINIAPCACDLVFGVSAGADIEICAGSLVPVTATLSGVSTSVTWSTTGTGIFANANSLATTYSPSITDILSGNVTLTATTNDPDNAGICVPKSDALSLIINPKPASAFGVACDDTLVCLGKSTKLIGFAPGATIRWYTSAAGGTSIGNTVDGGKLVITPTVTTTYYAEAITVKGCISDERTPVTVVVKPCFSDLEVVKTVLTPGPYSPGQLLNYAVTVKNLGVGNAANVTVDDILPASLNYVSSVPSGEYNSLTGVWTIGDMIVSSNRTLIITTTINPNASGTITNTSIVKSPDNDPSKTSNDTSSVTIPVVSLADLMLTKKVSKSNPVAGETITYTLEVKNAGPSVATNVEVTDLLPTGLEFVASADMTLSSNILKGTFATVGVGENKILTFTAKVLGTGSLRNIAQISKSDQPDPNSTPNNGYNQGEDDDSEVTVIVGCPTITPPIIACADPNICVVGSAILTAPNCAGTVKWSNGATGSSILVTPNATTTYTATCVTSVCESGPSNAVTINVVVPTAPIIASNKTVICSGDSATLRSTGCAGLVKWPNGMTGVSVSVKPTATTTYFATCVINACESGRSNTVTINVNTSGQPPVILASKTNTCAGEEVTLSVNNCAGVVMWSNGAEGASIKVTPTTTTSYTAICKATPSTCASGASNTVTINVSPATPPILTATSTSICVGDSSTITATGCTGTVRWSTGAIGASITVKPTATTTYTATCDRGTCVSPPASITINATSTPPPTIVCSTDSICKGGSVTLLIENCAGVANWSTGETGQAIVVTPLITTSYAANCVVNGCASPSSIQDKITVSEPLKPVLLASKNPITQGETTNITATGCAGSVIWSNGALGASISVFPTNTTTYSAICIVKECKSDTAKITITVNECVAKQAPTVTDKRNTCPDSTVDLRSAIVGLAAPGATVIYRLGNIPTSATVATPERAVAGTYYIFERSSTGCFSEPAKVVVTNFDCPDRDTLDLAVKKTVDKATVEVRGEVTYTIILKNNGPVAATNITWIDILPPQLEYIAGTGYSIEGNVIKGTIPLLAANDSLVFSCAVRVIGPGTIINTVQISNLDQIDTKPSNDISSVGVLATGGELGSALGVSNIEAGNDGTFTVTYKAIVKNYSSTAMTNIQMIDSLLKAFPAPTDFIVMSALARPGSTLVINPSFDGKAQPGLLQQNVSTLAAGAADTITFQVKVTPNGFFGPFYNSMTTMATIGGSNVMDISNSGFNTLPLGSTPTPTRFDQPNSLGIAKMAGIPVEIENGVFDVPYSIKVTNLGMNDLTNIQVSDDLNQTFGNGASIVPGSISVTVDAGFTVNPSYTGTGTTIDLLNAATSTLPKGTTRKISIMVRVDTRTATSTAFTNTAIGSALGAGGVVLSDSSASGENPDPNNDLDPSNDSDPTPIVLNNIPGVAMIGVALSVEDTTRKSDGSYDITYKAILKNFGSTTLTNVQLIDSLSKVFSLETGATFKKVGTPIASNVSELAVNPDFDGVNDYDLLIGGNSKLNPGVSDTLRFTVNVSTDGRDTPYLNRVYAFAKAGDLVVTDISTNGLLPDLNGNNDPTEASESEPTPIVIPAGIELFIPEGFSPNGDGINDVFVIRNAGGQRVNLEIYNRWMTLVYKNSDYKNDWDGTVNSGLRVGSTSQGLPDGTYFYVVKLENGRQYVRFLTITR